MVQETVVIVEDVPLGDGVIAVMGSEFRQHPIGDVLLPVGAVLVVGVKGEGLLWIGIKIQIRNTSAHQNSKFFSSVAANADHSIFCFRLRCWKNSVLFIIPRPKVIRVDIFLANGR